MVSRLHAGLAVLLALPAVGAHARVTDFSIHWSRPVFDAEPFGRAGVYERLDATATFAIDPASERASRIVDIDEVPTNADGEVEFGTEVVILRPVEEAGRAPTLLYDVPNRGRNLGSILLDRADSVAFPELSADAGDGFRMRRGLTLVWSGWQADLPDEDLLNLELPVAPDVRGLSREEFVFDDDATSSRATLTYPASDTDPSKATLTVRATPEEARATPEGLAFRYVSPTEIEITRPASMDGGAIYELVYPAEGAVPEGLAFVATSDLVSFLRGAAGHDVESPLSGIEHTIGMGISQSGRFLRDFIHQGFNADEGGARVFDGAMPHIAGSRKSFTNYRFAQPGRYSRQHEDHDFPGDQFPFTYARSHDPLTGTDASLLDACTASDTCPKIMQSDTSTEFWQGRAALLTTSPEGEPLTMPENVRLYFYPGAQHFVGWGAQSAEEPVCRYPSNPISVVPMARALLVAMQAWVEDGTEPPASRYPTLADGTLTSPDELELPALQGSVPEPAPNVLRVADHTSVPPVRGDAYPSLVPTVDADGIAQGGVASPLVQVPLGTHLGWNLRAAGFAEGDLCGLSGTFVPFPETASEDDARTPRDARYASADAYVEAVRKAAEARVEERFMLPGDIDYVVERARADAAIW